MEIGLVANLFAGILAGIFFRSFTDFGGSFVLLILTISLAIYLSSGRRCVPAISIFLAGFALGILRFDLTDTKADLQSLSHISGKQVSVEGTVIEEPSKKDNSTSLIASISGTGFPEEFHALILTSPHSGLKYGDRIAISGRLERIKNFSDDFDYASYMAKDELYYQFLMPKITLISGSHGSYLKEKLFAFKRSFLENLDSSIREPESSLMGGIILGSRSSLDEKMSEDFKKVGLIHIVALSGYNVTVVADNLAKMVWFLPLPVRLFLSAMAIVAFAVMAGAGSTVVRASIMVLLALLARATGRVYLAGAALLVAAVMMIVHDPKILVFDLSFQLSFLATAGLVFLSPVIEERARLLSDRFGFRSLFASTLSAQLAVWPLILYKMGTFSLVSIPANLLVGPFIPAAMFFGFATGLAGFAGYYLALPFGLISYLILLYIGQVAETFAYLPFSSLEVGNFPAFFMVLIYALYLWWIIVSHRGARQPAVDSYRSE